MANSNVVAALYGGNRRNTILPQTLLNGTETELAVGGDFANAIALIGLPSQNAILGVQTTVDQTVNSALLGAGFSRAGQLGSSPVNNQVFDNSKPFQLRLCGTYAPTNGVSPVSITFRLYQGTSKAGQPIVTVPVANTNTVGSTNGFIIEAMLTWNSISQLLRGQFYYDSGTSYQTYSAITPATAVTSVSSLVFCSSIQWSGSGGGGTVNVSEMSLTQL